MHLCGCPWGDTGMSGPASSQAHVAAWGGVALLGHSALNFLVVSGVTGFALPLVSLVVAYAGSEPSILSCGSDRFTSMMT